MNKRRERFVKEYLIDFSPKDAAIRAGYSAKTASESGCNLLRLDEVKQAVEAGRMDINKRMDITHEQVVAELARIAFSKITDVAKWSNGGDDISIIASAKIDDATQHAISEIYKTSSGLRVKMHDKQAALVALGKYLGMFELDNKQRASVMSDVSRDTLIMIKERLTK